MIPLPRLFLALIILLLVAVPLSAQQPGPDTIVLTEVPGWNYGLTRVVPVSGGYRVIQNYKDSKFSWAELKMPIDLDRYPELLVDVEGADLSDKWCIKIQPAGGEEVWLITETEESGEYVFPIGEYLDRYGQVECTIRFFIVGRHGANVKLKRLELLSGGARGRTEQIAVDENAPRQKMDGAGGQADYPLWTIGKDYDHVTPHEIEGLIDQLQEAGVSLARVGAYGDVIQAATSNPTQATLQGLLQHLKLLHGKHIKALFVTWSPPPDSQAQPLKSDAFLTSFVAHCANFIAYCHDHDAPIAYFELQNEPHANLNWWSPQFLAKCAVALTDELERRKLDTEVIGPDNWDLKWVIPWTQALGARAHIVALKSGANLRGTMQMTAQTVRRVSAACRKVTGLNPHFWLSEYGSWAWGNPDADRRAQGGPADGYRYGVAMAELTHYYVQAGISCPSIWELYDVRRIDEVNGKTPPEPPKRWGMFKYKTENWEKRAHYATLGHYYRALAPGSQVWAAHSSGGLLPTAVSGADGWHIILFNRFRYAKTAVIQLPSGQWGESVLWSVTAEDNPLHTIPVAIQQGAVTIEVPPYGVGSLIVHPDGKNLIAPVMPLQAPTAQ